MAAAATLLPLPLPLCHCHSATATELPLPLDRRAGNEQITVERGEFRNKHLYLSGFSGRVGGRRLVWAGGLSTHTWYWISGTGTEQVAPHFILNIRYCHLPPDKKAGNGEEGLPTRGKLSIFWKNLNSYKGWTEIWQIRVIWAEFILFYIETFYNLEAVEDLGAFQTEVEKKQLYSTTKGICANEIEISIKF